jgi:hypothetical protein
LAAQADATRGARPVLGGLLAAVAVVDTARTALDAAVATRERAEQDAAVAEQRAEEERGRLADARRAATAAGDEYAAELGSWRADPQAVPFDPPDELTAETVGAVATLARAAADGPLDARRAEEAAAGAERRAAEREHTETVRRREEVAAERDPAPPAPPWRRGERDPADGAPLWRLVDFATRWTRNPEPGVEAALEASGLLDAWIRADGAVLDADGCDVVLPIGPPTPAGSRLDAVLWPDQPDGGPVDAAVIRSVLARVALAGHDEVGADEVGGDEVGADIPAVVGTDGSWRLGPLTGRSTKPVAQYVGATARAAERARRLAELDARIAALAATRDAARDAETAAREARAAIEVWLTGVPSTSALLTAWTRLDERERVTAQADRRAAEAEEVAVQARVAEAGRRRDLAELAAAHDLPMDAVGLAARASACVASTTRCPGTPTQQRRCARRCCGGPTTPSGRRPRRTRRRRRPGQAIAAQERADTARAAADELEATVGASLREIQQRIAAAEQRAWRAGTAGARAHRADRLAADRDRRSRGGRAQCRAAAGRAGAGAGGGRRGPRRGGHRSGPAAVLASVSRRRGDEPHDGGQRRHLRPRARILHRLAGARIGPGTRPQPRRAGPGAAPGTEAALFAAWQDAVSGPRGRPRAARHRARRGTRRRRAGRHRGAPDRDARHPARRRRHSATPSCSPSGSAGCSRSTSSATSGSPCAHVGRRPRSWSRR